jgi:small subunit ribosomal protein S9
LIESINNSVNNGAVIKTESKANNNIIVSGIGKRKTAKARAEIKPGSGTITVNGLEFQRYFPHPTTRGKILFPLDLTDTTCLYDINLHIQGGGHTGQAEAAIPAISKALIKINPEWRPILAKNLCLKHDPRNVEPKKPGKIKARKGYVYNRR